MVSIRCPTILKVLELVLVIVILVLHYHLSDSYLDKNERFIIMGTNGCYFLVLMGIFAGKLMNAPVNSRVVLLYSVIGFLLFGYVGLVCIETYKDVIFDEPYRIGMSEGISAIVLSIIFFVDAILTFREG